MLAHFIDSKTFQCGYFKDRKSLFEEYLLEDISEVEFEYLLANGMRHFGDYYFRPQCKTCHECVPIRVPLSGFAPSRSQKRSLKTCKDIEVKIGSPQYSRDKFQLYLKHKKRFQSLVDDVEDEQNFRLSFYVKTPFGIEFEYYHEGKLVGAALGDVTRKSFSAIYTFYDLPDPKMSLGTFSVLKQIEYSRNREIENFYLGYYITGNQSLTYKAKFRPNEVYIDNNWRPMCNARGEFLIPGGRLVWENKNPLVKASDSQPELI